MDRNRGYRGKNPNAFGGRGRGDARKPWRPNFNSGPTDQDSNGARPWRSNFNQGDSQEGSFQMNNQVRPNRGQWTPNFNRAQGTDMNHQPWQQNYSPRAPNQQWQPRFSAPQVNDGYWVDSYSAVGSNQMNQGNFMPRQQNYNNSGQNNYENRRFPQYGKRRPYDKSMRGGQPRPSRPRQEYQSNEPEIVIEPVLSPLEKKVETLINAVQAQEFGIGHIVLTQNNNEIPPVLLNNAVHQVKNCTLTVDRDESNGYSQLKINDHTIVEGMYSSKKDAKEALYELGLEFLKCKCFYITSKSHYDEVSMDDLSKINEEQKPASSFAGSKAHQMMLKMGWGGKGLGTQEQGEEKSVAEKIVENITREGLGNKNVFQEVDKILADYARSVKTTTIAFDSSFTKEERAQIHQIAAKYHLKSKSEGGFNLRRITISKKMSKWILVRQLLMAGPGLENESYILTIPEEFEDLYKELFKEELEAMEAKNQEEEEVA
ncbi:unnamed protein product [Phaedon cochleariae]|uniref:Uncharacterized protein n=1 Tax=Phaedon cochleariae TaxID=80249 RepID=A0A9P0GW93_PHACE|nr:unnamed protein product [Phaedon cochleariae]